MVVMVGTRAAESESSPELDASSTAQKADAVIQNLLMSTVCRSPEFMMHLLIVHTRPIIEYASVMWNTGYVQDQKKLESVQRLWARHVSGLEGPESQVYGEHLKTLDLFSVEGCFLTLQLSSLSVGKCFMVSALYRHQSWVSPNSGSRI